MYGRPPPGPPGPPKVVSGLVFVLALSLSLSLHHTHTYSHTHMYIKQTGRVMLPIGNALSALKRTNREVKANKKILKPTSPRSPPPMLPSHLRSASNPHQIRSSNTSPLPPSGRLLKRSTSNLS